jgi:hypothetical protein
LEIINCTFDGNENYEYGGALRVNDSSMVYSFNNWITDLFKVYIVNSMFKRNWSIYYGGAIAVAASSLNISSSGFIDNFAWVNYDMYAVTPD